MSERDDQDPELRSQQQDRWANNVTLFFTVSISLLIGFLTAIFFEREFALQAVTKWVEIAEIGRTLGLGIGGLLGAVFAIKAWNVNRQRAAAAERSARAAEQTANDTREQVKELKAENDRRHAREDEQQFDATRTWCLRQMEGESPALRSSAFTTMQRMAHTSRVHAQVIAGDISAITREELIKRIDDDGVAIPYDALDHFTKRLVETLVELHSDIGEEASLDMTYMCLEGFRVADQDLSRAKFNDSRLANSSFNDVTALDRAQFTLLNHAQFKRCDLSNASFVQVIAEQADFTECDLVQTAFSESRLQRASFGPKPRATARECYFEQTDLTGAIVHGTWQSCQFIGAIMTGADLSQATFKNCRFNSADLSGANLEIADFDPACKFDDANLEGATWDRFGTIEERLSPAQVAQMRYIDKQR